MHELSKAWPSADIGLLAALRQAAQRCVVLVAAVEQFFDQNTEGPYFEPLDGCRLGVRTRRMERGGAEVAEQAITFGVAEDVVGVQVAVVDPAGMQVRRYADGARRVAPVAARRDSCRGCNCPGSEGLRD